MALDRRRFLQLTTAGIAASLTQTGCTRGADSSALAQPTLVEMLGPERTREIGARYRATTPAENNDAALRAAISGGESSQMSWLWRQSVENQIRDDFAAGRVVMVNGWVLAVTEARQCALYSLSA